MNPTEAYPLAWPIGWARTPPHQRKHSKYVAGIAAGTLVRNAREDAEKKGRT